jgi:hypothetical protein
LSYANIPLLVPSHDFMAVKLQWEAKAAAVRKDAAAAEAAAAKLSQLSQEPGQHRFAKLIISPSNGKRKHLLPKLPATPTTP